MKTLQSLTIIFVSSFFIFSSCNREENIKPISSYKKIIYVDGITSHNEIPLYENWKQFYSHINSGSTVSKLADFERKYSFVSLLGEFIRASNDPNYALSSDLIHKIDGALKLELNNYGFAALINKDGLAIIGAGLYKFKGANIYSLPLEGLNMDEGIRVLNLTNPIVSNKNVRLATYKVLPQGAARVRTTPSGSISQTILGCQSPSTGCQGTHYRMIATVVYGAYTQESYSCPTGLVYDEDARGYVCADPVVYDGQTTFAGVDVFDEVDKNLHGNGTWIHTNYYEVGKVNYNYVTGYVTYTINGVDKSQDFDYITQEDGIYQNLHTYSNPGSTIDYDITYFTFTFESTIQYLNGQMRATLNF